MIKEYKYLIYYECIYKHNVIARGTYQEVMDKPLSDFEQLLEMEIKLENSVRKSASDYENRNCKVCIINFTKFDTK